MAGNTVLWSTGSKSQALPLIKHLWLTAFIVTDVWPSKYGLLFKRSNSSCEVLPGPPRGTSPTVFSMLLPLEERTTFVCQCARKHHCSLNKGPTSGTCLWGAPSQHTSESSPKETPTWTVLSRMSPLSTVWVAPLPHPISNLFLLPSPTWWL